MSDVLDGGIDAAPGRGRRQFLKTLAVLGLSPGAVLAGGAASAAPVVFGPPQPFDFDRLTERAEERAAAPYVAPETADPKLLEPIDFDAHWRIRFRRTAALSPAGPGAPVQMFALGRYFQTPVRLFVVSDGEGREALYRQSYFDMPEDSPARALPDDVGFAGFRVMRPGHRPDWVSFLGASYFRADGPFDQYGLSARGICIDTGLSRPEEFPAFVEYWLTPAEDPNDDMTVYGLLDGPSVAGAYRFDLRRGGMREGHRTAVTARLFFRSAVERFGVAPLTSMHWYGEGSRRSATDWRPEVHDTDGLAIATGAGERIWRPLRNPRHGVTSSYLDENPAGFGLVQRDRSFENYQDDGAFYDRRPSAWITPADDWGRGAVQLVELPTGDETSDNIVAYWTPETQPRGGDSFDYSYAIDWTDRDPPAGTIGRVTATYQGAGGHPGLPPKPGVGKIVVDFDGPMLRSLTALSAVEAVVEARNGEVLEPVAARPVVGAGRWRLSFDFTQHGQEPVEFRAYLRRNGSALTETWIALAEV